MISIVSQHVLGHGHIMLDGVNAALTRKAEIIGLA